MPLIIAFLVVATLNLTSSAPVLPLTPDNNTTTHLAIFGRELPDYLNVAPSRTIQDIIWSCLATIFACTWVAVHPNVPRPEDSGWKRLKQRVVIVFYAILTPEVVILWAMRQRVGAAKHMKEYNKKFYPSVTPPSYSVWWGVKYWFCGPTDEKSDSLWNITHGFLLEMDGLVDGSGQPIHSVECHWRLGSGIPDPVDIPEDEIYDKSKGDFLTKLLVVLQTTWFIFQCLARWMTHLPVTELEVVTLAFALLNIGTYILWWDKPQNMSVAIRIDRYRRPKKSQEERKTTGVSKGNSVHGTPSGGGAGESADEDYCLSRSESSLEDQPYQEFGFLGRAAVAMEWCVCFHPGPRLRYQLQDVLKFVGAPFVPLVTMAVDPAGASEYDRIFYSSKTSHWKVSICFLIVGTLFGGLHVVPLWSSSLPPSPEKILWQLSAVLITVAPFISVCLFFFGERSSSGVVGLLLFLCIAEVFCSYLFARVILVVLAFTTLREPPPDAFRGIAWSPFLPHF